MAEKSEIKAIRALLSRNKITLRELRNIVSKGKGVSAKNDKILKSYNNIRGLPGKLIRNLAKTNKESAAKARAAGKNPSLLGRFVSYGSQNVKDLIKKEKITPEDVTFFKNINNLNDKEFNKIVVKRNPQTEEERKIYSEAKKIFTADKMPELQKDIKKNSITNLYNKVRDTKSGSRYDQEQRDANEDLAKKFRTDSDKKSSAESEIAGLLGKIPGVSKGTGEKIAESLPDLYNAYQQYQPEPRPRYGQPTNSRLLGKYDNFINMVRPPETGIAKFARQARPFTNIGGSVGGGLAGTALGSTVGLPGLGGVAGQMLGSAGSNYLTNLLSKQNRGELAGLGDLLSGGQEGYFSRGKRGLADLIAGTKGKPATFGPLIDIYNRIADTGDYNFYNMKNLGSRKAPLTRFQRLRRQAATPVRGLGNLLKDPNAANNIRAALSLLENIYNTSEEVGLNRQIGKGFGYLGRKLGILGPEQPTYKGYETGDELANPIIENLLQSSRPFLQKQTSEMLGRNVSPEEVTMGLESELRNVLGPQIRQRNIDLSNANIANARIQQRKQIAAINRQTAIANEELRNMKQQQEYQQALRNQDLVAQESAMNVDLTRRGNRLTAEEAVLGQKQTPQPELRRVIPKPTRLWDIAEQTAAVRDPIIGRKVDEFFGGK